MAIATVHERGVWRAAVAVVLAMLLTAALFVAYTAQQIDNNNRKWCKTIVLLNSARKQAPPPQGSYGRQLANDFVELQRSLGCGP